jgi:tRNA A-37 threonylcarbamoyl transferase component Bud32/GAF domain-containing protein
MTTDDWQRISAIFHEALVRPREERSTYIEAACGADSAIRARVERLLAAQKKAGSFGEAPLYSEEDLALLLVERGAPGPGGAVSADSVAEAAIETGQPWPFLGFVLAAAAATIATFAYAAWLLLAASGVAPFFGWEAAAQGNEWQVTRVAPDGPAAPILRPGDRLLSMNSTPPGPDIGLVLHLRDLAPGDLYDLTIERDGAPRDVELRVGGASNAGQLIYYGVSLVWCVIGLFIGFARPETALARLASATAIAVGFVFLQVSVIRSGPLWQPLHGVLGFHFLARFPTGQPTRGAWRIALVVAYVSGIFAAALGLLSHVMVLTRGTAEALRFMSGHTALFALRWPVGLLAFAIAVLGMVLSLLHNYRQLGDEDQRRRVRWVLYGAIVGLTPQLWWTGVSLIDSLAVSTSLPRFDLLVNALTVTIPLTMAYAVVKHRVLDIRVYLRLGLQYVLARRALQAIAALPFLALIYVLILDRDLTIGELATESATYIVWLVLAACALKFRRSIAAWLDRRFFREEFDREQLVMRLLDESRRVESLSELSSLVSDTLAGSMHPSSAFVWYRDAQERMDTAASNPALSAADFPAGEELSTWLERQETMTSLPVLADAGLAPEALHWLQRRGIEMVVPMADSADRLVGALFLGGKMSEEPYDRRDSQLLDAVAKQMGILRENLRLRERLGQEVRVRHDVLSRLDDRLPDLLKECPVCGRCFDGTVQRCPDDDQSLAITLPVARTVDGRYRLECLLGRGGMGAVYEAEDLRLARRVAIKIMLSKGIRQAGTLRRFHREARAAARLSHPNIVTVYDFGSLDGEVAYIVMQRVRGETLRAVLDRDGTLTLGAAREWFEPMLAGLAAAHASGIVHRDLKPENVMGDRDASGALNVMILDLGLAKLRATEHQAFETRTQEGLIMGTPSYMSPEQLLGNEVDQRSDIFAVGVMLLESLTGQRARSSDIRNGYALRAEFPNSALPAALSEVLASCLAEEPDARPASAAALSGQLLPLLVMPD